MRVFGSVTPQFAAMSGANWRLGEHRHRGHLRDGLPIILALLTDAAVYVIMLYCLLR